MTSTLDDLLAGIIANPADDTARLIYADALDDAGRHDRATFMRLQIAAAQSASCDRYADMKACSCPQCEEVKWFAEHGEPDNPLAASAVHTQWHRGFIGTARAPLASLLKQLPAMGPELALVEVAEPTDVPPDDNIPGQLFLRDDSRRYVNSLPLNVFDALVRQSRHDHREDDHVYFYDQDVAFAALSTAILSVCRDQQIADASALKAR